MPDIQGGYSATMSKAFAGMQADSRESDIVARVNETADVGFGVAMVQGDNEDGVKVAAAGFFIGITVRDRAQPPEAGDTYQIGDGVSLLQRGSVWVTTAADCVAGNPVYRTAAGALTPTAAGNTVIDRAYFETAAAAGSLARVMLH